MSVQVEKLEKNMAKLTVEVPAEEFVAALEKAYQKKKNQIFVQGFRKGKAPRKFIQKMYGAGIFFEDAANIAIPDAYSKAADECGEEIVSRPTVDIVQIEEGKPFIFTAEVALKPGVVLGEYKGLEVTKTEVAVSEEEVDAAVNEEREKNSREIDIDDRPAENGDTIKLDFEGFLDGVPFEGGKASDYALTLGSGSFIPGFEEQLVGKNIGEDVEVKVTFPENYQAENLRGRETVFQCRINSISVKELPEADDEFAQEVSEFETLEEYRDDLRASLLKKKTDSAKREKEKKVIDKAVENAQMDIPDPMVDEQVRRMVNDFARRISSQGITVEQYLQFTGLTAEQLNEQMRPEALRRIRNSLVLEEIAKTERIEISDERLAEEIKKMAESYKMDPEKLEEALGEEQKEQIRSDLKVQAAVDLIRDAAVETEAVEEAESESAAEDEE